MDSKAILLPVTALAFWTFVVLLNIPFRRFRAGARGQVTVDDFRYGESKNVPPEVSIPNRNYMNLLELPVLFYVACLLLHAIARVDAIALTTAWVYVGLRVVHSLVHLTYNNVRHRLAMFATSNMVLLFLWVRVMLALLG